MMHVFGALLLIATGCAAPVAPAGLVSPASPAAVAAASPAAVAAALARCAPYRTAAPEAYGFCLRSRVATLADAGAMAEVCAAAGSWQADCHAEWVLQQSRLRVLAPAALLDACGPSADCALQQLDAHPDADVLVQVAGCQARTGAFVDDCVAHAVQRWAVAYPDAPEVERVVAGTPNYAVEVGTFVGMIVACAPTPAGPASGSLAGSAAGSLAGSGPIAGASARCPEGGALYGEACRRAAAAYAQDRARCGGVLPSPG